MRVWVRLQHFWGSAGRCALPPYLSLLWPLLLIALTSSAAAEQMRLRVAWGGGTSRAWSGQIVVEGGQVESLDLLGLEADELRTVVRASDRILLRQTVPRTYSGVDLTLNTRLEGEITVEIHPTEDPSQMVRQRIPVSELISGVHNSALDDQGNRILVRRAPGDVLRVSFERSSLVFSPGEVFRFSVAPHLPEFPLDTAIRCRVELRRSGDSIVLVDQDHPLQGELEQGVASAGPVELTLPDEEGVYELELSLYRRRFAQPFVPARVLRKRKVQLVVISGVRPAAVAELESTSGATAWQLVDRFDPANPNWMERLTRIPRLPWMPEWGQQPLGNQRAATQEYEGKRLVKIGSGVWQAYPLPISEVGRPHVLEVEYPAGLPQTLGISIIEPNAAGDIVPIGHDSGVDVQAGLGEATGFRKHRILFWPKTKSPLVLLDNRRSSPAFYGTIRLLAGPETLPARSAPSIRRGRELLAYFDKPLFPENFSAREALDAATGRSLNDWNTFYEGTVRLAQYLKNAGYDGAIISSLCEGSTLFPSQALKPTPKYDNGVFFTTGQDPVRKDILEMMLRVFDREGLQLVPALHLACPLVELETLRRQSRADAVGLELIHQSGKSWLELNSPLRGQAPYYNPLDGRVQNAVQQLANELLDRYRDHSSFGGLALQLGPDTFATLPGPDWCLDSRTHSRFLEDMREKGQTSSQLTAAHWLNWRAEQMTTLYHGLADALRDSGDEDRKLYLLGSDLLISHSIQTEFQPRLPARGDIHEALLGFGLDLERLESRSNVEFLRFQRVGPAQPLLGQAVNVEFRSRSLVDEYFRRSKHPAALWFHEPQMLRVQSFDAFNPYRSKISELLLISHFSASAEQHRRRLIHSLETLDVQTFVEGGWMLPMGQEDALRELFATYRHLPRVRFETIEPPKNVGPQPLTVRSATLDGKTYTYLLNESPWSVEATLQLRHRQVFEIKDVVAQRESGYEFGQIRQLGASTEWRVLIPPFDARAAVMTRANVEVVGFEASLEPQGVEHLQRAVLNLATRVRSLARPTPLPVLSNPGFEGEPLSGWVVSQDPNVAIQLDDQVAFAGSRSLKVEGIANQEAWVRSQPITIPKTGRLAVMARLRTQDSSRQPRLKIGVDGLLNGETYYRFQYIGADTPYPLGDDWGSQPYLCFIDNLPTEGLSELRVAFDVVGDGVVWIDEVQVFDLYFLRNERDELSIMASLVHSQFLQGNYSDCLRTLHEFWPRYLAEFVDNPASRLVDRTPVAPAAESSDARGSMWERLRNIPSMPWDAIRR